MIWHLVGLSGICREWFGQKWCHCTVRQLWVEQQHKLCWGHSPIESTVQSQSMPYATRFVCCALAKKVEQSRLCSFGDHMLHAFNILCKFSLSEYVDGDSMFFDVGLPWFAKSYVADFLPFFLLLGTKTARPWQIALRATAVWWSFISPATTSVIAELRRLCLGPLVSGEWATVSVAGLCWSCGKGWSSRGWGWSLCATPRSLWGAGLDLIRSSRRWSFQSIKTFHILSDVHPDAGQQKKESLRWHCEW